MNTLEQRIHGAAPIKVYFIRGTLIKYGFKFFDKLKGQLSLTFFDRLIAG